MANLYDQLAARFPADDASLAVMPDGSVVSYGAIGTRTACFANLLRTLGVGIGGRVAVQAEKSIDMLILYLATVRVSSNISWATRSPRCSSAIRPGPTRWHRWRSLRAPGSRRSTKTAPDRSA